MKNTDELDEPQPTELISFAQNCEDILLWRALGHIQKGFYIDVGANDPSKDSVTKLFYVRGWSGINVEPVQHWIDVMAEERPRDISLKRLVGTEEGSMTFFEVEENTMLSTTQREIAEEHQRELGYHFKEYEVPCTTLTSICDGHVQSDIHFLKVDVEGGERSVLEGFDFSRFRPWIVVMESTKPCTTEEVHSDWEHLLENGGYTFVFFNGLSRYYIANEHPELKQHFHAPANLHDRFVTSYTAGIRDRMLQAEDRIVQLEYQLKHALEEGRQKEEQARSQVEELHRNIGSYRNSRSWKATKWLRSIEKRLGKR